MPRGEADLIYPARALGSYDCVRLYILTPRGIRINIEEVVPVANIVLILLTPELLPRTDQ